MAKLFTKEGDDYKEVDAFLQPEVDEIVTKRLERERGKFADYDDLKKKADSVDTIKAEYETKLTEKEGKISEFDKELKKAKLETDKVKIVHEFNLGDDLSEFVTGETPEEMRKRAEKLAKGVKPSKVEIDKKPKPGDAKSQSAKLAKNLFGSKSDD